jgi:hypothetical protein
LECSDKDRAELTAMSRSLAQEARMVEWARIILACLEGKEMQQVAKGSGLLHPDVSKWRKRFGQQGLPGLRDKPMSGKPPIYGAAFRDRVLALLEQPPPTGLSRWNGPKGGGEVERQRACGLAGAAQGRDLSATLANMVREHRSGVRAQSG